MILYLQKIVETIELSTIPADWLDFDFKKFSNQKTLFTYQQQALENTVKALYKYYYDCNGNKKQFFDLYSNNGFDENLDLKLNETKIYKIYKHYSKDYEINNNSIAFYHFINRMSFWMATGSGKTLIIVKLIEYLAKLIKNGLIPKNEILFLTYREDLLDQFKNHVNEFNRTGNSVFIKLYPLKEYEKVKRDNQIKFSTDINVFYYRSDLISDEQKEKIVDFRNYDNNGQWYILLDEAHKGDKEDSKRQHYYSILSRNGFLFNFSATFTDPIDYATCVFNFNLQKFIELGYGKKIMIFQSDIDKLSQKDEIAEKTKQIIILKIFLLYAYLAKIKPKNTFYHNPLMVTLANSVNTEDSDLELFFREIEKLATQGINEELLKIAKEKLKEDLQQTCEFTEEKVSINDDIADNLTANDILEHIFHTSKNGNIEVLKIPGNKQELVFKLTTSDKPFGLIKIGDISEWLKKKLNNYMIIEKFENESVFNQINQDDSNITILMGSRSFYEGWDSNRPNIILYINIGKGINAKKFVLQSLGRGVRIEPLPNKRQRIGFLYNNNEISQQQYDQVCDIAAIYETLYVFGTKAENLKEITDTIKEEKQEEVLADSFKINPAIKGKHLLIPVYEEKKENISEETQITKFEIAKEDLEYVKDYYKNLSDKVILVKYDCQPKIIKKIGDILTNECEKYFSYQTDELPIEKPEVLFKKIINHLSTKNKEFNNFKHLKDEIIHFRHIRVTKDNLFSLKEKIEKVGKCYQKKAKENEIDKLLKQNKIDLEEYKKQIRSLEEEYPSKLEEKPIIIKYLQNHYYIPVCLSEEEKVNYITHVIKTKSEIEFIKELENYLQDENNFFKEFEWWFFSKIDQTLDEVYIPYYNSKTNKVEKFKPDFVFWLKPKESADYIILFLDPKSTEYSAIYRKIDGFTKIFGNNNNSFLYPNSLNYNVKVRLVMWVKNTADIVNAYKAFAAMDFKELQKIIMQ